MIVKLKAATIHAVQILTYLASVDGQYRTAGEIAPVVRVTNSYIMRILKDLHAAGMIQSVQGRYGGFCLRKKPDEITLYDVMRCMEGGEEEPSEIQNQPRLVSRLMEISSITEGYLRDLTLDQL